MRKSLCALAVALLLTGGCAAGGEGSADYSTTQNGAPAAAPLAESARDASAAKPGDLSGTTASRQTAPEQRAVVYTADLQIRTDKVENAAVDAKQYVLAAGGYIGSENTGGDPVRAGLQLKVPSAQYQAVLDKLARTLGTKVSLTQNAEDVTEQVADVDSRLKSAKSALDRLRKLLGDAKTVGEVLQVSGEIDTRTADLEALQARQKSLAQSTSFATINLRIVPPSDEPVQQEEDEQVGFFGGLENGWDAFVTFVTGVLAVVGWLLPFTIIAVVVGIPVWFLRRRRKRPEPPAPPASPVREDADA